MLALLCVVRLSMGMHFQSVPAIAPFLMRDLGVNYAQLGTLIGVFMVPGAFLALPGGLLGARFGDRAIVVTGLLLLMAGGGVFAASASFATALAGRVIGGAGLALLNIQSTKIVTDWFAGREISTAMGIFLSMWPLGMAIALATLGSLATFTSWPTAALSTVVYAGLALALFVPLYRDAPRGSTGGGGPARLWTISRREVNLVLLAGTAWMMINAAFVVFMSFTPTLLMSRGRSVARAGFLVSWVSLISVGSLPLAGWVLDRTRRSTWVIAGASVATALVSAAVPLSEPAWLWMVIYGAIFAPTTGVVALPSEILRPESRSTGFGLFYTLYFLGMAVMPAVAGYLVDVTGSRTAPLWFGALLWISVVPAVVGFRLLQRRATAT